MFGSSKLRGGYERARNRYPHALSLRAIGERLNE